MKTKTIHVETRRFYVGGRYRGRWPVYDTAHRKKNGVCRVQSWCDGKAEALRKAERLNAGNFTLEELQAEMELIPGRFKALCSVDMWRVGKMWKASAHSLVGEGDSLPEAVAAALAHALQFFRKKRS